MKAALFYAPSSPMRIEAIDIANPIGHEVLVRTAVSGVCHSDLHAIDRGSAPPPQPIVLGHEAAGIVEEIGPNVTDLQPGDHVIACLSFFCGKCDYCLVGRTNLCSDKPARGPAAPSRLSKDGRPLTQAAGIGAYAEQMLVHENALVKIRKDMPLDKAALISCGVITGVGAVLNRAKVAPASTVAVLGVGGVGMSVIQGARIAGARQIVVNATKVDPVDAVRRMSGGGVDYTFEAIGFGETARQAFEMLRDGGWATMLGVAPANATVEVPAAALRREKVLTGSSMGSNRFKVDIPRYIELYYQGKLMLDEMITKRFRLEQVDEAFQAMREGEVIRSVLMFD